MSEPSSSSSAPPVVDRIEDHGVPIGEGRNGKVRCNYCAKEVRGFNRLKHHLGGVGSDVLACQKVPSHIHQLMRTSLLDKRKERLLKEVGELYHPQLPLKRNFVPPASSQPPRPCPAAPSSPQPTVSSAQEPTRAPKTENADTSHLDLPQPTLSVDNAHAHAAATATATADSVHAEPPLNVNDPVSYVAEDADTVVKKELTGSPLLAAKCIGRFFYEAGIDPTGIKLPSFQEMIDAVISCGAGYQPPRYDELMGWILQQEVEQVKEHTKHVKTSWERTGCSILLDGWTDQSGRSLMGFLVDSPQGTIFLRSVDASDAVNDVDALFLLLSRVVDEVGPKNVVQVIAHDTSCYMEAASKKLLEKYRTIFWTLSADLCINMILEKIGATDPVNKVLTETKTITRFIYSHALPLELMKMHVRGGDLVKTSKLKWVANFLTLRNIVSERENLMNMFRSPTWSTSVWASRAKGKNIQELVRNTSFWAAAEDVLKVSNPLLNVLHQISAGDISPIAFLYEAMDRSKVAIMSNLGKEESKFLPLWTMIDEIWDNYLHNPIHSAGYYLNPRLFYSGDFYIDAEVTNGLLFCIVRMVEDQNKQEQIVRQLDAYREALGRFSDEMAITQRTTVSPALWWSLHGGQSPELQRFAIKILSQACCSTSRYKLKKGFSEQLHAKGSNCIEQQRFQDVEFVRNNLQLMSSSSGRGDESDDGISLDDISPLDDWIVES